MRNNSVPGAPRGKEEESRDLLNVDREGKRREGWGEFMNREQVSEERV